MGKIGDATLILVAHPSLPVKTLQELIAYSKKEAKGVSYGTSGIGGTPHIAGELLNQQTGSNLFHVPYKGGGQAMTDALGGNLPLVYTAVLASPEIVEKLATLGIAATPETPDAFAAQIKADLAKYGKVVKAAGIKAE